MKQYISELAAISLFLISILILLGVAGSLDTDRISMSQGIKLIIIGLCGLCISAIWINGLSGKEEGQ